ncbi:MAG TPA: DUF1361 domain-containing protein [Candidatus Saccharimonadales bacterium]|nr:DUF1361 domain-containing protein [Candidatus Saccharimonadales bacterium]
MKWYVSTRGRFGLALLGSSLVSCLLYGIGVLFNHALPFWYLTYNLFLAWIPLGVALWLTRLLKHKLWSSWQAIVLTIAWLVFLPNSFYMITDFIHLRDYWQPDTVYEIIMFSSFILNAFILGLTSLYAVHSQLRWRMRDRNSTLTLGVIMLATSFAIYIGRDLRWNTWDVILNPASILFDLSDRLLHPFSHPEMFTTTLGFFALIASVYCIVWYAARTLHQQKQPR